MEICGYYMLRADHPSNNKRGGICIFYRTTLFLRVANISLVNANVLSNETIKNSFIKKLVPAKDNFNKKLFVKAIFVLFKTFLKTLLNRKKIPCIPPVLHGDKYVVDFQEKSKIFNSFFLSNVLRFQKKVPYLLNYH